MRDIDAFETTSVNEAYVAANTPLFFAERLTKDASIRTLSRENRGALFEAIVRGLASQPTTLAEMVRPFALIAALYLARDYEGLERVKPFLAVGTHPWLPIVRDAYAKQRSGIIRLEIPPRNPANGDLGPRWGEVTTSATPKKLILG